MNFIVTLLAIFYLFGISEQTKDARCFPPVFFFQSENCVQDNTRRNSNFDCSGGHFVRTAGIQRPCENDLHCSELIEPNEWCNSEKNGYQWTTEGCHCDEKLKSCIVQRFDNNNNEIEWAYCTRRNRFKCEEKDYCSPPSN